MKGMKKKHIRRSGSDAVMYTIVYALMILLGIVILYPLIYVVSCSFSSGTAVTAGKVLLWPVEFSLKGYETVFAYKTVWSGYKSTILITVTGTIINVILTTLCAYPLSRKNLQGKKLYILIFMIPMFISGGMIPNYLLMSNLHLLNNRWSVILSGALSIYNMIIMKTFFENSIPGELLEAAKMDGITDIGYLCKIVIPLSKSIFSVIALYYAVGHWNSYFNAMLYLRKKEMWPLQMVLRDILNASNIDLTQITDAELLRALRGLSDVLKYALIIVSSVPILVAYPFVQKYFEKGVMIGSVKG